MTTKFYKGVPVTYINRVTQYDGFYVSYNGSIADYGSVTTALVDNDQKAFYILQGDYRRDYAGIAHSGYDACVDFFSKQETKSKFSDIPGEPTALDKLINKMDELGY
jgi:hypothetical protein